MERRVMERSQALVLLAALERDEQARMPVRKTFVPSPEDLRGIPAMAKGVGGVIKGTSPHGLPLFRID